jgi:hypothetical protein
VEAEFVSLVTCTSVDCGYGVDELRVGVHLGAQVFVKGSDVHDPSLS